MRVAYIGVVVACLSACANTKQLYYNSNLPESAVQTQFTIDNGYCTSAAVGSVPIPEIRQYSVGQESYTIRGRMTAYDNRGGGSTNYDYNARVTSTPSPTAAFGAGFANGASIGAAINAMDDRKTVFNGCMAALGWTPVQVPTEPHKSYVPMKPPEGLTISKGLEIKP